MPISRVISMADIKGIHQQNVLTMKTYTIIMALTGSMLHQDFHNRKMVVPSCIV